MLSSRSFGSGFALLLLLGCGACADRAAPGTDPNANADGDCLTDAEERQRGTDPHSPDSDGDGVSDCDEVACVSDPLDAAQKCYACGWAHNDPGNLVSTGKNEGDVIGNMQLVDQCLESIRLWDFAATPDSPRPKPAKYLILLMSATW